jgi:hypothetical protein
MNTVKVFISLFFIFGTCSLSFYCVFSFCSLVYEPLWVYIGFLLLFINIGIAYHFFCKIYKKDFVVNNMFLLLTFVFFVLNIIIRVYMDMQIDKIDWSN